MSWSISGAQQHLKSHSLANAEAVVGILVSPYADAEDSGVCLLCRGKVLRYNSTDSQARTGSLIRNANHSVKLSVPASGEVLRAPECLSHNTRLAASSEAGGWERKSGHSQGESGHSQGKSAQPQAESEDAEE